MTMAPSWELLVLGGTVLTLEPGSTPIKNGAVAISGGRIVAVGRAEELLEFAPTGEVLSATDCLILPGFVNTHAHLAMTLMRGIADDLPLKVWLEQHIWPFEREHMSRGTVRLGTMLAAAEQLLAGVTTTTDMYFFGDEVASVLEKAGMRGVVAEAMIDFATPRCATTDEMAAKQLDLIDRYRNHPLITPSVAAHATYTVSAANLVREAEIAEEHDVPLQIHLSETLWEVEQILDQKGVSPVQYLADLGFLSERTVASHCVHVSEEDLELLGEFEVGIAHNPASNLKLGSGIAPVPRMAELGLKVGLGTDGAASNNTLDLLRDAQLASLVHKGVNGDPTTLSARTMLEMLTVGGARVLGLDDHIGTLSEGKQADLVCIRSNGAHATPMYDPCSHLLSAARAADVRHVMVAGRTVVREGHLETLDLDDIRAQVQEVTKRIKA